MVLWSWALVINVEWSSAKKTSTAASIGRGTAYTKISTYTQIYKYNIHRYTYLIIFKHTYVYKYSQIHTLCCKNKIKIPFTFQVLILIQTHFNMTETILIFSVQKFLPLYFDWNFLRYTVFSPIFLFCLWFPSLVSSLPHWQQCIFKERYISWKKCLNYSLTILG